jgi:hypothetical protein
MDRSLKRKAIEEYVISARRERDIRNVDRTIKPEVSGIMQGPDGDIESLVERELLTTEIGAGAWLELEDPTILDAVFRVVTSRLRQ